MQMSKDILHVSQFTFVKKNDSQSLTTLDVMMINIKLKII
jgi:hypothetical protein